MGSISLAKKASAFFGEQKVDEAFLEVHKEGMEGTLSQPVPEQKRGRCCLRMWHSKTLAPSHSYLSLLLACCE